MWNGGKQGNGNENIAYRSSKRYAMGGLRLSMRTMVICALLSVVGGSVIGQHQFNDHNSQIQIVYRSTKGGGGCSIYGCQ